MSLTGVVIGWIATVAVLLLIVAAVKIRHPDRCANHRCGWVNFGEGVVGCPVSRYAVSRACRTEGKPPELWEDYLRHAIQQAQALGFTFIGDLDKIASAIL